MRLLFPFFSSAALLISLSAKGSEPETLIRQAVVEIGDKSSVPIYVPAKIPKSIAKNGLKRAFGDLTDDGYSITLYYSDEPNDATYAAGISGSSHTFASLPNAVRVSLGNGVTALFRPIQCGGSCAPANIWWQRNGVEYQIQLNLPSNLAVQAQKRDLILMANSMVPAQ